MDLKELVEAICWTARYEIYVARFPNAKHMDRFDYVYACSWHGMFLC